MAKSVSEFVELKVILIFSDIFTNNSTITFEHDCMYVMFDRHAYKPNQNTGSIPTF